MVSSAVEESSLLSAILAQEIENCLVEPVNIYIILEKVFKTLFLNV